MVIRGGDTGLKVSKVSRCSNLCFKGSEIDRLRLQSGVCESTLCSSCIISGCCCSSSAKGGFASQVSISTREQSRQSSQVCISAREERRQIAEVIVRTTGSNGSKVSRLNCSVCQCALCSGSGESADTSINTSLCVVKVGAFRKVTSVLTAKVKVCTNLKCNAIISTSVGVIEVGALCQIPKSSDCSGQGLCQHSVRYEHQQVHLPQHLCAQ